MKKWYLGVIVPLLVLASLLAVFTSGALGQEEGSAFAQLSSAVDQEPGNIVQFEQNDGSDGIEVAEDSVTVTKPGRYLVVAAPQVTASEDGGALNAWVLVNGEQVENSNVRLKQTKEGDTDVIITQSVLELEEGDKVQIKTSGNGASLDAIESEGEPLIPSIIFTITEQ